MQGTQPASVLADVLGPGLDILFCGTAAGTASAAKRAYYAGPGNAFWSTLFEVGLTPYAVQPKDYASLLQWRMGVTDLAKTVSGADCTLARAHFDVGRLTHVIAQYRPQIVAFTGKRAAAEFLGQPVDYGLLGYTAYTSQLFVLPSPSGAARRYWKLQYWQELARLRCPGGVAGRQSAAAGSIATPHERP